MSQLFNKACGAVVGLLLATPLTASAAGWMDTVGGVVQQKMQGGTGRSGSTSLTSGEITQGLREALKVGAQTVSRQLGAANGFNADPKVHIPLPPTLKSVQSMLSQVGMSGLADDVELKLNRGAEAAMPQARDILIKAVSAMTLKDAQAIYNGPQDAATRFFRQVATDDLTRALKPVITKTLTQVGALASYDAMMRSYSSLPMVPDVKANLTDHATRLALDGVFLYLAEEEAAIRQNPAKRSTDILRKVFGGP